MKKKTSIEHYVEQTRDLIDSVRSPNIYKYLDERGVSEEIANGAQEMINDFFNKYPNRLEKIIHSRLNPRVNKMEKTVDKFTKRVGEINNALFDVFDG